MTPAIPRSKTERSRRCAVDETRNPGPACHRLPGNGEVFDPRVASSDALVYN